MAQYAIIKHESKAQNAKGYYSSIVSGAKKLYYYFGNPVAWSIYPGGSYSDTAPPTPTDSQLCEKQIWDGIIGMKKVSSSDIVFSYKRIDWVSGNYYDMYRDDYDGTVNGVTTTGASTLPLSLSKTNSLVLVYDSGSYKLYRCIDNRSTTTGYAIPSTTKPTFTTDQIQTLSDGYRWKYYGTLTTADAEEFLTSSYAPIPSNLISTKVASGQVISIVILSRGAGYTSTPTVTVKGDGTGLVLGTPVLSAGSIAYIPVTTAGSGYTYLAITISGGGTPTTTATARAVVAPYGGFGNNVSNEIDPNYLIARISNINTDAYFPTRGNAPTAYGATSGTYVTSLTYRSVGLLEDPLQYNSTSAATDTLLKNFTEFRYNTVTGTVAYGDRYTSPTSGLSNAIGTVVAERQDNSYVADIVTINAATAVNASTKAIAAIGHGLVTGDTVNYSTGGGTTIGNLTNGASYFVIKVDTDNFKLASSLANAQGNIAISITPGIGSTHTFTDTVVKGYISFIRSTEQLVEQSPLVAGNLLTKTDSSTTMYLGPYATFNSASGSVVVIASDTIVINAHPFLTGDQVVYTDGGGTTIPTTGSTLVSGNTYYIIRVTANEIRLATSYANAIAKTNIDLTGLGVGTHTLNYTGSDSISYPTVQKYTGNVVFAEYRNAVTRSTEKEKFRFVLEF
jgi:hypothetical protein